MTDEETPAERPVERYAREMAEGEWMFTGDEMLPLPEAPMDDSGQRRLKEWLVEQAAERDQDA
jgi:hypothetical protein